MALCTGFSDTVERSSRYKIDVEKTDRNREVLQVFYFLGEAERQGNAAAANSDEGQALQIFGFFQDFMGQPHQGAVDLGGAHELGFFACGNHGLN